ncbi:retinol dehydrogenase 10-like [Copidosoma floridanum]|uniref:retinol dehydrogenase 10-like n=1 Tax=Copidosoma floridanum TaxID=29053 RepID=UPI0006C9D79B|nr:retinol dehydrogenase 10-like [Copidosoma floridanum]XP_014211284.1 retinol dehydrogenase 10-like [Copidosoma floridanum]
MLALREEAVSSGPTGPSSVTWFYLSFEFLLGLAVSGFLVLLAAVKSALPKPPRDLTGDVVLVTGATSSLGSSLAEEFARGGCSVICVDGAESNVEETASRVRARYPGMERIGPRYRDAKGVTSRVRRPLANGGLAYRCNLWDRDEIKELAEKVREDVGRVDVLVTCAGSSGQGLLDTISQTLMSHYWTVLAFLPSMLNRERAHVIGVTPSVSTEDAYMGSKAAIAGLMESLGEQLSGRGSRLTFMTVAPRAEPRSIEQNEREIAKGVVQAVQRDMCCISTTWSSKVFYQLSCKLYAGITAFTRWLDT